MLLLVLGFTVSLLTGAEDGKIKTDYDFEIVGNEGKQGQIVATEDLKASNNEKYEFALIHKKDGFFPKKVYAKAGHPVKLLITGISGRGKEESSFIIDEFNVYKGVSTGEEAMVEFIPKKQGAYKFYCPITNKKGWLIVR